MIPQPSTDGAQCPGKLNKNLKTFHPNSPLSQPSPTSMRTACIPFPPKPLWSFLRPILFLSTYINTPRVSTGQDPSKSGCQVLVLRQQSHTLSSLVLNKDFSTAHNGGIASASWKGSALSELFFILSGEIRVRRAATLFEAPTTYTVYRFPHGTWHLARLNMEQWDPV